LPSAQNQVFGGCFDVAPPCSTVGPSRERRAGHVADLGAVEAAGAVHGGAVELPHPIVLPPLVRAH